MEKRCEGYFHKRCSNADAYDNILLTYHKEYNMSQFVKDLLKELRTMKACGMRVPGKALKLAESCGDEYSNMKVSEAANLMIALA